MIKDCKAVSDYIVDFISGQVKGAAVDNCIIGVSGGIDSSVIAALSFRSGLPVTFITMPLGKSDIFFL